MVLHVFNPDTEYALASDRAYYTPPGHVVTLRREQALLPALYASPGDAILLLDKPPVPIRLLPYHDVASAKGLEIVGKEDVRRQQGRFRAYKPEPWGWNRCIRQVFMDLVGELPGLPDNEKIEKIRELSHRRITAKFFAEFSDMLSDEIEPPVEIFDAESGMEQWLRDKRLYFKAPWSSSGRGITLTDDREAKHVEPWLRGIIQRQGSVMMEKAYQRSLDFATEWLTNGGKAQFLGYSVFNVSRRGKYHSNVTGSQQELMEMICDAAPAWNKQWLERQQQAIEKLIAPHYDGHMGIDLLVTENGNIDPCVEINLRRTMGMIHL